jgi:hypothetical protein
LLPFWGVCAFLRFLYCFEIWFGTLFEPIGTWAGWENTRLGTKELERKNSTEQAPPGDGVKRHSNTLDNIIHMSSIYE